jgi:hypothetical protein
MKSLLFAKGDGIVPKSSLTLEPLIASGKSLVLPYSDEIYQCEGHNKLVTNPAIQDKLFLLLRDAAAK